MIRAIGKALENLSEGRDMFCARENGSHFLILRKANQGKKLEDIHDFDILPAIQRIIGERYAVSLSYGINLCTNLERNVVDIIEYANSAMIRGSQLQTTTFTHYTEKLYEEDERILNITYRMDYALKHKEFEVRYQPKFSVSTQRICGAEALVKWEPKIGSAVSPEEFIPVFERNGFIEKIDMYVLEEVCHLIGRMKKEPGFPIIAVNLSGVTLMNKELIPRINYIFEKYNIEKNQVEFEINEGTVLENERAFTILVNALKKSGFKVVIDDFGLGGSSLEKLVSIPADGLKIRKSFIQALSFNERSRILLKELIVMAKQLKFEVTIADVDTEAQRRALGEYEFEIVQGSFYEESMSCEEFIEVSRENKEYELGGGYW